jgi:hypothetical protein
MKVPADHLLIIGYGLTRNLARAACSRSSHAVVELNLG